MIKLSYLRKVKNQLFAHYFEDFSYSDCLNAFQTIKNNSECIFAKVNTILKH
jgi:hypothetical protein